MASDNARDLRQRGIAAAKAGQKDEARQLLQQAVRLDPNSEPAWLWLASVANDARERLFCLEKVLGLNPNNETALKAVGGLRDQVEPPSSPTPPVSSSGIKRLPGARASAPRRPSDEEIMAQAPGVPLPALEPVAEAQRSVERIVQEYRQPLPSDLRWTQKRRARAGENDVVVYRAYIGAAIVGVLVLIGVIGVFAVTTNDDLRGVVFGPTATFTRTPTVTPTFTPGLSATPSPLPRVTFTPSPTVPINITPADIYNPARPTDVYPEIQERAVANSAQLIAADRAADALPTLQSARRDNEPLRLDPNPYYYEALALLGVGRDDDALETLQEAEDRLDASNNSARPLVETGFAQVYLWQAEQAADAGNSTRVRDAITQLRERADAAIEGDERIAAPYILLARAAALERDYEEAVRVIDQGLAVANLRANVELIIAKAQAYFDQGEFDLAEYQAYLALYIDPYSEAAYQLRVNSAMRRSRPGEAVLAAQDYLHFFPGSTTGWRLLGDAHAQEGSPELALQAYNQGLAGNTDDADSVQMLVARAAIYTDLRRDADARADLERALDAQETPAIRAARMEAAFREGRYQIALNDLNLLGNSGIIPETDLLLREAQIVLAQASGNADYNVALARLASVPREGLGAQDTALRDELTARAQFGLRSYENARLAIDAALTAGDTAARRFLRAQILQASGERDAARRDYEWVAAFSDFYPTALGGDARAALEALG